MALMKHLAPTEITNTIVTSTSYNRFKRKIFPFTNPSLRRDYKHRLNVLEVSTNGRRKIHDQNPKMKKKIMENS